MKQKDKRLCRWQEGFTVPEELTMQSSSTCIDLETDMLKDRDEYFQKIELGKKIFDKRKLSIYITDNVRDSIFQPFNYVLGKLML